MSNATYIRFGAKNNKGVRVSPQTITLATIVGEPLNFGGTIRLTDPRQIEKLLGDGTKYKTEFEDGSHIKWFTDVTSEYADRERKVVKAAVVDQPEPQGEEDAEAGEGTEAAESTEESTEEQPKPAAQDAQAAGTTRRRK